jgi:hypothetical protein
MTGRQKTPRINKTFSLRGETIVSKTINDGRFEGIAGGGSWIALLEEDVGERKLHFYSTQGSQWTRGIVWFVAFVALAAVIYYMNATLDMGRLFSRVSKKKGQKREMKYV